MKDEKGRTMEGQCESAPLDVENKFKIRNLEARIKNLDTTVQTLVIVCDKLAKINGLNIERCPGFVVISQI